MTIDDMLKILEEKKKRKLEQYNILEGQLDSLTKELNQINDAVKGLESLICPECKGTGEVKYIDDPGGDYTYGTCDKCRGSGVWIND